MFNPRSGSWLGQVPLVPGYFWHGSFINTAARLGPPLPVSPDGIPPYFGEWGIQDAEGRNEGGRVGPYDTREEAFQAAAEAAGNSEAQTLPRDGFVQVVDSRGVAIGSAT